MSAFALDYSGDPVPCAYPGCTLESFHDGEHLFAEKPAPPKHARHSHCVVCGRGCTSYGEIPFLPETCGEPECVLHFAIRYASKLSVLCPCPQRPYPHELSIHLELRRESYNPKLKHQWPWSLALAARVEPSTEKEVA